MLGVVKGAIENKDGEPTDELVLGVLKTMRKTIVKSLEEYDYSKEAKEATERELSYIEGYFPQLMSEDEIRAIVTEMVNGGSNNVGAIMGGFNKTYKGLADNKVVKQVADELLS